MRTVRLSGTATRALSHAAAGARAAPSAASKRPTALLLDCYGVLLTLAEPVEVTYKRLAEAHGVKGLQLDTVKRAWRAAWADHRPSEGLRYEGDGAVFWRRVVHASTGSDSPALFDDVFAHYGKPEAWRVAEGARESLARLRASGLRLAVVSNFDTRLRPLLHDLKLAEHFDALSISAEVGVEKPDSRIWEHAAAQLGTPLGDCLHVGDSEEFDVDGARKAGAQALLFGRDLTSFAELEEKLGLKPE